MKHIITGQNEILGPWLCARTGGEYTRCGQYIGMVDDGEVIACVGFEDYNGRSIRMHVAGVGKRWMTKEYLRYCFYYPFIELGVNTIIGLVDSTNADALRFDRHLGFEQQAVLEDAGQYGDLIILTMAREHCRFIDKLDQQSGNPDDGTFKEKDSYHGR